MPKFQTRGRRWLTGAIAAALFVSLAALLLSSTLEHAVRARIESAAVRHGMVARIGQVHVGVWPLLRLAVSAAALAGPAGIQLSSRPTAWDIAGIHGGDLQLTLVEPHGGLLIRKLEDPLGSAWSVEARGLDVGHLLGIRRESRLLFEGGIADGRVDLQASSDARGLQLGM